jgi:hypothetical protein
MSILIRPLRTALIVAASALAFAAWVCIGNGCKGEPSEPATCKDPKLAPTPPPPIGCSSDQDCPLPASQMENNSGEITVYYFSNPLCVSGQCTYCMTETMMEDPCATGLCH